MDRQRDCRWLSSKPCSVKTHLTGRRCRWIFREPTSEKSRASRPEWFNREPPPQRTAGWKTCSTRRNESGRCQNGKLADGHGGSFFRRHSGVFGNLIFFED